VSELRRRVPAGCSLPAYLRLEGADSVRRGPARRCSMSSGWSLRRWARHSPRRRRPYRPAAPP